MIARPTLKQLQYLQALSSEKNFHNAARKCNVSQSTLSAGIIEIEKLLGLSVIDRNNKKNKTSLTPFGQEVLKTANNVLDQINHLTARAQNISAPLSGPFRLGIIPTIAPYLLPNILPKLQKEFPKLEFQIVEDLTEHLIKQLDNKIIDLAILAFPYETKNLKQTIFYEENFFAASQKNTFKNKVIKTKDLENKSLLLLEDGHCLRDHALSACKIELDSSQKSLSATSLLTLIQMAAQGNGITLLPEMVIKHGFLPKSLEITPFQKPQPTRQIGAAWNDKNQQMNTINSVVSFIKIKLQ